MAEGRRCPSVWSIEEVAEWLDQQGLSRDYKSLFEDEVIDGEALLACTTQDLKRLGMRLGDVKKVESRIAALRDKNACEEAQVDAGVRADCKEEGDGPCTVQTPSGRRTKFSDAASSSGLSAPPLSASPKSTPPPIGSTSARASASSHDCSPLDMWGPGFRTDDIVCKRPRLYGQLIGRGTSQLRRDIVVSTTSPCNVRCPHQQACLLQIRHQRILDSTGQWQVTLTALDAPQDRKPLVLILAEDQETHATCPLCSGELEFQFQALVPISPRSLELA